MHLRQVNLLRMSSHIFVFTFASLAYICIPIYHDCFLFWWYSETFRWWGLGDTASGIMSRASNSGDGISWKDTSNEQTEINGCLKSNFSSESWMLTELKALDPLLWIKNRGLWSRLRWEKSTQIIFYYEKILFKGSKHFW